MWNWKQRDFASTTVFAFCALAFAGACQTARGATICVNPALSSCQATIGKAVAAANPGDTIQVAAGTYKEVVTITSGISLIGSGSATTIIDAKGLANGVVISGGSAGLSGAAVSGFTIKNANFQGILVENASSVTIWNNQVVGNDASINVSSPSGPTCPGLPAALANGEDQDCGEGIHLTGVDHSVVANNVVSNNAGGILISDDLGATFANVISGNVVSFNPYDCGITLASHSGKGVYGNTVSGNQSLNNGLKLPGQGAGVGIFAPGPGSQAYGNVVINNQLMGNGLPGVTMHNHAAPPGAPAVNFNDNVIAGNVISSNGADFDDASSPGPAGIYIFSVAPVTGTIVSQNAISQETVGVVFHAAGTLTASLNNFLVPSGVDNLGSGTLNATLDWWGCPAGANTPGCATAVGTGVTSSAPLTTAFGGTQLPSAPPSGGTTPPANPITIVINGPGATTPANNTFMFQSFGFQVNLDASQSKSSNTGALSYSWTVQGPSAGISNGNTATPILQLPRQGTYQFTLTVTDTTGATAVATVIVQYS